MKRWIWAVAVIIVAAGCGGSGVSVDEACTDIATAVCNKRSTCSNGASVVKVFGSMANCLARSKLTCVDALIAPGNANTPAHEEQCATAWGGATCTDFLLGNEPAACVVDGTLAAGAACEYGGQCASSYCTGEKAAQCGSCGEPPATGADCTTSACARGQVCFADTTANTMTCVVDGTIGATCSRTAPCAPGSSCVGATTTVDGTCMTAAISAGAACDNKTGPGCARDLGLYCNTTSATCTTVQFAADGAACDTVNGPSCTSPARCVPASGSTAGTCYLRGTVSC
ncbi:MAG TPA: hypothetical protein VIA18_16835 [Polyangia bacterium]|nr:hypothetical protein [Polyangia bacterium]